MKANLLGTLLLLAAPRLVVGAAARDGSGPAAAAAARRLRGVSDSNLDPVDGPCDDSFPLASESSLDELARRRSEGTGPGEERGRRRLLVPLPDDESSFAPLCDDGRRIDVRRLNAIDGVGINLPPKPCSGGSCFSAFYQQCTFECTWTAPTPVQTTKPTMKPTTTSQSDNHVLLELQELLEGYRFSPAIRSAIVKFLNELLVKNLGYDLQILDIQWPGYLPGQPHSLPVEITSRGPTDVSEFSLTYILETIREHETELRNYLEKLDGGEPFKNVAVEVDTYDPNDIVAGPTDPPSLTPTKAPEPVKKMDVVVMEEESGGGIPWFVWLILAIVIIGLCCCCVWYCSQKADDDNDLKKPQDEKQINIWVDNGGRSAAGTRSGRSTATKSRRARRDDETRATSRSRRTSASRRARTMVSRSFTKKRLPEEQENERRRSEEDAKYDDLTMNAPTMAAVSVMPVNEGFDPPENNNALVLYNNESSSPPKNQRDPTMYVDNVPRTMDGSRVEDPDGAKVNRKKSMFGADATQTSVAWKRDYAGGEDPSECNSHRREPEADMASSRKTSRSRKKAGRRDSFGDRLKSSFNGWGGKRDPTEIELGEDCESPDPEAVAPSVAASSRRSRKAGRRDSFGDRLKSSFTGWSRREHAEIELEDDYESPSVLTNPNGNTDAPASSGYGDDPSFTTRSARSSKKKKKSSSKSRSYHDEDGSSRRNRHDNKKGLFSSLRRKTTSDLESIDI